MNTAYLYSKELAFTSWAKKYSTAFISTFLIGLVVHFQLYSNMLRTPDSLWSSGEYFANGWELSLGRWCWEYIDKLEFGTVFPFLSVIIALTIYSLANMILLSTFNVTNKKMQILVSGIVIVSPIIPMTLQYYCYNDVFALAYMLAILSIYLITRDRKPFYLLSICCLALSLGFYQSYLGIAAIVAVASLICNMEQKKFVTLKHFILELKKYFIVLLSSVITYYTILQLLLRVKEVKLAVYKGASGISLIASIKKFPLRLVQCYKDFFEYFFGSSITQNAYGVKVLYLLIIIMLILICGILVVQANKVWEKTIYLLLIIIIPIACNIINLIATDTDIYLLTIGGMLLVAPISLILFYKKCNNKYFIKRLVGVLFIILIYCFSLQDNADSTVLLENYRQTSSLANRIWNNVENNPGYIQDMKIMIAGNPNRNSSLLLPSDYIDKANWYARIGLFWNTWSGSTNCWRMFIKNELGININSCTEEEYRLIAETTDFQSMPAYPSADCIQIINNVLVVKISDIDWIVYD